MEFTQENFQELLQMLATYDETIFLGGGLVMSGNLASKSLTTTNEITCGASISTFGAVNVGEHITAVDHIISGQQISCKKLEVDGAIDANGAIRTESTFYAVGNIDSQANINAAENIYCKNLVASEYVQAQNIT